MGLVLAALALPRLASTASVVTNIDPNRIGYGGGTINIHGDGFATDAFSQFDPSKGNKVDNNLF